MRVAKWIAIVLFISFSLNSCFRLCGCSPAEPDTTIDIIVKNSSGEDMLNPTTTGYLTLADVTMSFVADEKAYPPVSLYIEKGVTTPSNIYEPNLYRLSIFSNGYIKSNKAITLLAFKGIRTDTLTCFYSGLAMTKVLINSKSVWDAASQKHRTLELKVDR